MPTQNFKNAMYALYVTPICWNSFINSIIILSLYGKIIFKYNRKVISFKSKK